MRGDNEAATAERAKTTAARCTRANLRSGMSERKEVDEETEEDLPSRSWRALKWRRWRRCHTRIWFWMNGREPLCSSEQTRTRAEKSCTRRERQRQRRVRRGGICQMRAPASLTGWKKQKKPKKTPIYFTEWCLKDRSLIKKNSSFPFYIIIQRYHICPANVRYTLGKHSFMCFKGPWLWSTFMCMWSTAIVATVKGGTPS